MKDFKKHLTSSNLVLIAALVIAVVWAWSTVVALEKNYNLEKQMEQARLDNEIQEIENQNLALQQAYFSTNEYLELQARDKLNKALPGEHLVILPKSSTSAQIGPSTSVSRPAEMSNFEQWMQFLFGRR